MPILEAKQRFTRQNVERAPARPGVYALYTDDGVAFYGAAGRGETIRSRLADHLSGVESPGGTSAKYFNFEVTRFPLSRECALLEEHRRATWAVPPFNDLSARPLR